MNKDQDTVSEQGKRSDAELFEDNLVDAAWIPLGFAWDSPDAAKNRARKMEEFARDKLNKKKQ